MGKLKAYITYVLAGILIFSAIIAVTYYINTWNFSRNTMLVNKDKNRLTKNDSHISLTDSIADAEISDTSEQKSDDMGKINEVIQIFLEEDAKEANFLASSVFEYITGYDQKYELEYDQEYDDHWYVENYNKDIEVEKGKPDGTDTVLDETYTGKDTGKTINILFLGIDRTEARDKTMGVYRTDTIALASIHKDTKKVDVLCIPRDTYIYIPCIDKKDKINHAYVWGGMGEKGIKSTIDTINQFIKHSKVKYYFLIDMEPIPEIIDKIGGVEIDVEIDIKDDNGEYILSEGKQVLDGTKSLFYIRWRYSGGGDTGRMQRQQKFLKAVWNKLKDSGRLIDALKIVLEYSDNIKTNIGALTMFSLAELAKDIDSNDIVSHIIPGKGEIIDNIWYWIPDEEKTEKLLVKLFGEG